MRASEQRDDAAGVGGCAAVVVAFLPEAADVVCYVAGEALVWVVLAGNSWGRAGGELGERDHSVVVVSISDSCAGSAWCIIQQDWERAGRAVRE